jgi:hypothetical protein
MFPVRDASGWSQTSALEATAGVPNQKSKIKNLFNPLG